MILEKEYRGGRHVFSGRGYDEYRLPDGTTYKVSVPVQSPKLVGDRRFKHPPKADARGRARLL